VTADLLDAALDYRVNQWYPTPVARQTKKPTLPHWPEKTELTFDQCVALWEHTENNIGLITGITYDVLDIDGEQGRQSLSEYLGYRKYQHEGPISITGGGGRHLYFQATGEGNRALMLPKVDFRGTHGMVVAPPSIHASGRPYEWVPGHDLYTPLPAVPDWLRKLITPPTVSLTPSPTPSPIPRQPVSDALHNASIPYRQAGGRFIFRCPTKTHNDSDWSAKTHATDRPDQWWMCFGCGATGDARNLIDGSYVRNGKRETVTSA
jgi:hypothetical protein